MLPSMVKMDFANVTKIMDSEVGRIAWIIRVVLIQANPANVSTQLCLFVSLDLPCILPFIMYVQSRLLFMRESTVFFDVWVVVLVRFRVSSCTSTARV